MRRVEQRDDSKYDCGVACLAMVVGLSYSSALSSFRELKLVDKLGRCKSIHKQLQGAIEFHGRGCSRQMFRSWRAVSGLCIVKVNLRSDGDWHWVVHSQDGKGQYVYDPKPGKSGRIRDFRGLKGHGQYLVVT